MPKLLIIEPCIVNFGDDAGGIHQDIGARPEVTKHVAAQLVLAGRALYAAKSDDPSKGAIHTASAEMLKAAESAGKASAATAEQPQ